MNELIIYAPHAGAAFKKVNTKIFQILQDIGAGTSFELSIKNHQKTRDGIAVYQALLKHNFRGFKVVQDSQRR